MAYSDFELKMRRKKTNAGDKAFPLAEGMQLSNEVLMYSDDLTPFLESLLFFGQKGNPYPLYTLYPLRHSLWGAGIKQE